MSEPIYGRWYAVQDVPIPTDPDAWIVTAQKHQELSFEGSLSIQTVTTICAHYPGTYYGGAPPARPRADDAVQPDVWLRIPPPPWLEGK